MNTPSVESNPLLSVTDCLGILAKTAASGIDIQKIRSSLVLSRVKIGAAINCLETPECQPKHLFEVSVEAEQIARDVDHMLETMNGAAPDAAADSHHGSTSDSDSKLSLRYPQ